MRKSIIAAVCSVVVLTATAMTAVKGQFIQQPAPYVAVFCSQEFEWIWVERYQPEKLEIADQGWAELVQFCQEVKKEARGRPIVIDLTVHGNDHGLAVTMFPYSDVTTVGHVINVIERNVGTKNVTVLLEACFPGNAYYYTIRSEKADKGDNYEGTPKFPIYGVGSGFSNWGNTVYLQWRFGSKGFFEDLRTYETKKPNIHEIEDRVGLSESSRALMMIFYRLYSL